MSLRFIRLDSYYHRFDTRLNARTPHRQTDKMKSREKNQFVRLSLSLCVAQCDERRGTKSLTEKLKHRTSAEATDAKNERVRRTRCIKINETRKFREMSMHDNISCHYY